MRQIRNVSKTKVFDKFMVRVFTKVLWLDSPSAKLWGLMVRSYPFGWGLCCSFLFLIVNILQVYYKSVVIVY